MNLVDENDSCSFANMMRVGGILEFGLPMVSNIDVKQAVIDIQIFKLLEKAPGTA